MKVAVVAGFQGISPEGRITTLGRGGSDTTAVAFAAAFEAERCDIYTDVDGVYTTDPRITSKARKLDRIAFEEMLETGLARGQGAADPFGRAGDALQCEAARAEAVSRKCRMRRGRWSVPRRISWESNVVAGVAFSPRRGQDDAARRRGPPRHRRRDLPGRWRRRA